MNSLFSSLARAARSLTKAARRWKQGGSPGFITYSDGNAVQFDDTASGGTNIVVTLNSTVAPSTVSFANLTNAFTIAGSGNLNVSSSGSVQLLAGVSSLFRCPADVSDEGRLKNTRWAPLCEPSYFINGMGDPTPVRQRLGLLLHGIPRRASGCNVGFGDGHAERQNTAFARQSTPNDPAQ